MSNSDGSLNDLRSRARSYRQKAEQALLDAAGTDSQSFREACQHMAEAWLELAKRTEQEMAELEKGSPKSSDC